MRNYGAKYAESYLIYMIKCIAQLTSSPRFTLLDCDGWLVVAGVFKYFVAGGRRCGDDIADFRMLRKWKSFCEKLLS